MRRAVLTVVVAVVACSGRALAHGDGNPSTHALVGSVAFLVGVALVALAVVLDARDAVASGRADAGVFLGGGLALVGLATSLAF